MKEAVRPILSSVALFAVGYFFCSVCIVGGYSGFEYAMTGVSYVFLLISPLSVFGAGTGGGYLRKLLRAMLVFFPATLLSLVCPLIMSDLCDVSLTAAYTAILGTLLHTLALVSVLLLLKFLVGEKAGLALGYALVIFLYLQESVAEMIGADTVLRYVIASFLTLSVCITAFVKGARRAGVALAVGSQAVLCFSLFFDMPIGRLYPSLTPMLNSIFDGGSVIFFLTVSLVSYMVYCVFCGIKNGREARACVTALVALSVFIFGNVFIDSYGEHIALDASGKQLFTFSDEGREYLFTLDADITVYELHNGEENVIIEGLLRELSGCSEKISVERINTLERPMFAEQYTDIESSPHSLIISNGERHTAVKFEDIVSGDTEKIYNGESLVLSAIFSLKNEGVGVVVYGEELDGEYTLRLSELGFLLTRSEEDAIPTDTSTVIINAKEDISDTLLSNLVNFWQNGGDIILISEAYNGEDPYPNISRLSEGLGISASEGCVLDDCDSLIYPSYLLPIASSHKIATNITSGDVVMPTGQSLSSNQSSASFTPILTTGDCGYLYFEDNNSDAGFRTEGYGVHTVAAIAEKDGGCFVRFSSPYLFSGDFDMTGENFRLLLSTLCYTSGISMPPNTYAVSLSLEAVTVSTSASRAFCIVFLCILPPLPLAVIPIMRKKARKLNKVV